VFCHGELPEKACTPGRSRPENDKAASEAAGIQR
jgi:hypothetical protein